MSTVFMPPHCVSFYHGYEHGGGKLGVLWTVPMSAHQAALIADWGGTTLYLNGHAVPDRDTRAMLDRRAVAIEPAAIRALQGERNTLSSLLMADNREIPIEALFLAPRSRLNSHVAEQVGCALDDGPFGPVIRTDAAKLTTVPGVYAAGDIARARHNASWAAA